MILKKVLKIVVSYWERPPWKPTQTQPERQTEKASGKNYLRFGRKNRIFLRIFAKTILNQNEKNDNIGHTANALFYSVFAGI